MWMLRIRFKSMLWKATAKAIWYQSEAMRIDYRRNSFDLPFHTWLGYRVFGDERGYRAMEDVRAS